MNLYRTVMVPLTAPILTSLTPYSHPPSPGPYQSYLPNHTLFLQVLTSLPSLSMPSASRSCPEAHLPMHTLVLQVLTRVSLSIYALFLQVLIRVSPPMFTPSSSRS